MKTSRVDAKCIFYELRLWRLAGAKAGSEALRPVNFVRVGESLGEACPSLRGGETMQENRLAIESILSDFDKHWLTLAPTEAAAELRQTYPMQPAARAAIEMILYDRAAREAGKPLYAWLELDPPNGTSSSYPMMLRSESEMTWRLEEAREFSALHIRCVRDPAEDLKALRWLARHTEQNFRIDAGGAWTLDQAQDMLAEFETLNVEYIVQPLPAHRLEEMKKLRRVCEIPIIADLDVTAAGNLEHLIGACDGVTVRLMNCGGITEALRMIHGARELGLLVNLCGAIESSAAATAAAHLAAEADFVNLHGHLQVENDPIEGVTLRHRRLYLPHRPGLGIEIRQGYLDYLE